MFFSLKTLTDTPQTACLPWKLADDRTLLCLVGSEGKSITTLADIMCDITRERGVTEIRVTDHGLAPKMQAPSDSKFWSCSNFTPKLIPQSQVIHHDFTFELYVAFIEMFVATLNAGKWDWYAGTPSIPLQGHCWPEGECFQTQGNSRRWGQT